MSCNEEEEPIDPRIQHELENLNRTSLLINKLENDLDRARSAFRSHLTESAQQLEVLTKKLGSSIDKAKPYYDCRLRAFDVQVMAQQAATRYERAISMQNAAREMVELAEQGYETRRRKQTFDTAWQEMLNHATIKVMDAENERTLSQAEHQRTATLYAEVQEEVNAQYKENKRSIARSKPYYEMKANFHTYAEQKKSLIEKLERDVKKAKKMYSKTLGNLETISEEIHARRQDRDMISGLGERGSGVGAECPDGVVKETARSRANKEILIEFPPVAVETPRTSPHTDSATKKPLTDIDNNEACDNELQSPIEVKVTQEDSSDGKGETTVDGSINLPSFGLAKTDRGHNFPVNSIAKSAVSRTQSDFSIRSFDSDSSLMSPIMAHHRRTISGTLQLSAKRLLEEAAASDSDTASVNSFVMLDDEGVANAMADQYFDELSYDAELENSTREDYSKLPDKLSQFQKSFEESRRSWSFNLEDDEMLNAKVDQVMRLLDETNDESVV